MDVFVIQSHQTLTFYLIMLKNDIFSELKDISEKYPLKILQRLLKIEQMRERVLYRLDAVHHVTCTGHC